MKQKKEYRDLLEVSWIKNINLDLSHSFFKVARNIHLKHHKMSAHTEQEEELKKLEI